MFRNCWVESWEHFNTLKQLTCEHPWTLSIQTGFLIITIYYVHDETRINEEKNIFNF